MALRPKRRLSLRKQDRFLRVLVRHLRPDFARTGAATFYMSDRKRGPSAAPSPGHPLVSSKFIGVDQDGSDQDDNKRDSSNREDTHYLQDRGAGLPCY